MKEPDTELKETSGEFMPPEYANNPKAAGHGGMDWFAYKAFSDALKNGEEMPIDIYDAATWMAVSVLSEKSIASGGAPQLMPDFTNGKWHLRSPKDVIDLR
jgi:hypothetical protein